jgi:Putative peptidoglycan binding domain
MVKSSPFRWLWILALAFTFVAVAAPAQTTGTSKSTTKKSTKKSHRKKVRGQQKMDPERVRAIQEALVREHYLEKPTGQWDATTQSAMQRYQDDNGWQTKVLPDSRALIKLGLGPDHDHLLNPESAMTSMPATAPTPATQPTPPDSKKQ